MLHGHPLRDPGRAAGVHHVRRVVRPGLAGTFQKLGDARPKPTAGPAHTVPSHLRLHARRTSRTLLSSCFSSSLSGVRPADHSTSSASVSAAASSAAATTLAPNAAAAPDASRCDCTAASTATAPAASAATIPDGPCGASAAAVAFSASCTARVRTCGAGGVRMGACDGVLSLSWRESDKGCVHGRRQGVAANVLRQPFCPNRSRRERPLFKKSYCGHSASKRRHVAPTAGSGPIRWVTSAMRSRRQAERAPLRPSVREGSRSPVQTSTAGGARQSGGGGGGGSGSGEGKAGGTARRTTAGGRCAGV